MDNKIFDLIRSYILKTFPTKQDLLDLNNAIISNDGENEACKKFVIMRNSILSDRRLAFFNDACKRLVVSTLTAIMYDLIEGSDNNEETSFSIATELILKYGDLINSNDYIKADDSFLPACVINEFDKRLESLNKDYYWYKDRLVKLHILDAAYINLVGFNAHNSSPVLQFIASSSLLYFLLCLYCLIPRVILALFIIPTVYIWNKPKNKQEFIFYFFQKLSFISRNKNNFMLAMFTSATIINYFILRLLHIL